MHAGLGDTNSTHVSTLLRPLANQLGQLADVEHGREACYACHSIPSVCVQAYQWQEHNLRFAVSDRGPDCKRKRPATPAQR